MQWTLDKYNRLLDSRNMPLMIERGPFEQLFLQFDNPLKMLFVYHNGSQLEMFLLHPLVFPHDLVRKDQRLLFCIKNQSDGSVYMKFRVRFSAAESVRNFCATIGKYIGVKAFEDWSLRSCSPFSVDLANTSIASTNHADPDQSTSSISLLNCFSQCSKLSSQDAPPLDLSNTQRTDYRKFADTYAQTDIDENANPKQQNLEALPSSSASSVHLHIENMFSAEAAHEFGNVLRQLMNDNNGNKIKTEKRKKKVNGKELPKKPLNSFMLWAADSRKRNSAAWNDLPKEEKEHWKLRAAAARINYKDQMETYKNGKSRKSERIENGKYCKSERIDHQ